MLTGGEKKHLEQFIRATNYLSVTQIFLRDNVLLDRPLIPADIKPRLLGHWGSCPGVNIVYAHLSLIAKQRQLSNMLFLLGTGHAFPALQANLFLEESLKAVDPKATLDQAGIEYLSKQFSWPYGFPSHASPSAPGVILEGGELGYSLSTAFGAVLDNPDAIAATLIGDGEAETAALAGSWQLNKLVAPGQNGVVLPILHLNGYKISGPTIFGRMSDRELHNYFDGMRYQPLIVDYRSSNQDEDLHQALTQIFDKINDLKSGTSADQRLPILILRSPKGWSGPKDLRGQKIADNNLSHQVVLDHAATDPYELARLEQWLKSYKFDELFKDGRFGDFRQSILPEAKARMGNSQIALGRGDQGPLPKLIQPELAKYNQVMIDPGELKSQSLHKMGDYLAEIFKLNADQHNFRFFSPDETTSNRLDAIFQQTNRAWTMQTEDWDEFLSPDGRSMELLSEQSLQGMYQGYTLSGRHGVLTSYEAFVSIITSMVEQHAKFLTQAKAIPWRPKVPSLNFILTSVGWRQDHNGYSHQNPSFIDAVLRTYDGIGQLFFPADDNSSLVALDYCLQSQQHINVITAGKTTEPRWRTLSQAQSDLRAGAAIWDFASDEGEPDLVLAAAGDYMVKEALYAVKIIKQEAPDLKIRFVYVSALSTGGIGLAKKQLTTTDFEKVFTKDKPIIFNFHGYPETIKAILFNYLETNRADVHGYIEQGSTTTPFDMMVRNQTSRYHLAMAAFEKMSETGKIDSTKLDELIAKYRQKLIDNTEYIKEHGDDLPEIKDQSW